MRRPATRWFAKLARTNSSKSWPMLASALMVSDRSGRNGACTDTPSGGGRLVLEARCLFWAEWRELAKAPHVGRRRLTKVLAVERERQVASSRAACRVRVLVYVRRPVDHLATHDVATLRVGGRVEHVRLPHLQHGRRCCQRRVLKVGREHLEHEEALVLMQNGLHVRLVARRRPHVALAQGARGHGDEVLPHVGGGPSTIGR